MTLKLWNFCFVHEILEPAIDISTNHYWIVITHEANTTAQEILNKKLTNRNHNKHTLIMDWKYQIPKFDTPGLC